MYVKRREKLSFVRQTRLKIQAKVFIGLHVPSPYHKSKDHQPIIMKNAEGTVTDIIRANCFPMHSSGSRRKDFRALLCKSFHIYIYIIVKALAPLVSNCISTSLFAPIPGIPDNVYIVETFSASRV